MRIISDPLSFEWDSGNISKNLKKHNVTNQEAEETFFNNPLLTPSLSLGRTNKNRKLFSCFTIRNNKIRIISIRDMNKKEAKIYEKI